MRKTKIMFLSVLSIFLCIGQLYAIDLSKNKVYDADVPEVRYIGSVVKNDNSCFCFSERWQVGSIHGTYNNTTDMRAAWHPNVKGQRKMAMSLIPYISTIMNW